MELRRRDVLAALGAAGVATTGALTLDRLGDDAPLDEDDVAVLVAAAEVVYPGPVEGVPAFVERYTVGRTDDRPAYAAGVTDAVAELDSAAREWYDAPFADLGAARRDDVLRELGCDTADPDPEGTVAERVRFHVVNELLYALYTTPTGGELAGVENPQGHPGGTASYQRGPDG
jgi:hypothetical protein